MERQTITVDIAPGNNQIQRLKSSQGDIGRPLGVYIIQNGAALDCSAYTADLYILKPDGNYFTATATVDATEHNLITWETAKQETPVAGDCAAQIRILSNGDDVGTARFVEYVEASPGFVGESSESVVESLMEYVRQAATSAETASGAASSATGSANAASGSASSAAQSASAAAGSASTAHTDAETASQAAQTAQDVAASIPEDYSTLSEDVTGLKSVFDKVDEALITQETATTVVTADSGVTWENGYFWQPASGVMTKTAYASTSCAIYGNVQKGDIFRVTARSVGSAYALCLADVNGNVLDYFVSPSGNSYYSNAEYIVPSDGVLYLNTATTHYIDGEKYYKLDSISRDYYPIADLKNEIDETAETANANKARLDDLEESLPTKQIFVDVMPGLVFVDGAFVSDGGSITSYSSTKYAVYGEVHTGNIFKFTGRKVGSAYCILLVTSDTPVNNKFTVLDVVTTGYNSTGYITDAIYTVPQNGYLIYQSVKAPTGLALEMSKTVVNISSSSLDDIKWTTLGDSLNEFNSTAKNNWIKYMIAETGVINTNLAASGTGFYRGKAIEEYPTASNYIAKISQIPSDTQLITIAGSFNDLMSSPWEVLSVGTATDTGTDTIAGYMNDFFDALLSAFPLTPIGVYMTAPWSNYHYGVERSDSYVSVLKEICLKRGIPFFDNAYYGNTLKPWNEANRIEYYTHDNGTVDGVHPNDKGHVFIYQMLKPFIESLSPKNPLEDINS